jgi:hypothetical protein
LPITHRDDFLLAASVFDHEEFVDVISQEEMLVTYAPEKHDKRGYSLTPAHNLHYAIVPRGTLDRYYEAEGGAHTADPNPELLFGKFVYQGEIKVQGHPEA